MGLNACSNEQQSSGLDISMYDMICTHTHTHTHTREREREREKETGTHTHEYKTAVIERERERDFTITLLYFKAEEKSSAKHFSSRCSFLDSAAKS